MVPYLVSLFLGFLLFSTVAEAQSPVVLQLKAAFDQGVAEFEKEDYPAAINSFNRALEIYSNFSPAYYFLGLCHKAKGGTPLSEVAGFFEKAIEINPKYAQAYEDLSRTYFDLGRINEAIEMGEKALEQQPNLVTADLLLAWIYLLGKDEPGQSIVHFKSVLDKVEVPNAYFGLGLAYFNDGQRFQILEIITRLKQLNQNNLAEQLENLMRASDSRPSLPSNVASLMIPQRQRGALSQDHSSDELIAASFQQAQEDQALKEMPVRLRSEEDAERRKESPSPSLDPPSAQTLTGSQRIRELQKKGSNFYSPQGYSSSGSED